MKLRNIKNIGLIHIAIILAICTLIIFIYYQYNATRQIQYDISINENAIQTLPKEDCIIENMSDSKVKITCIIDESYLEAEKYNNYVIGPGIGRKINFSILLNKQDNFYKIKTFSAKQESQKICLVGYIESNDLSDNLEIFLLNNENGNIYQYIGGINEETM